MYPPPPWVHATRAPRVRAISDPIRTVARPLAWTRVRSRPNSRRDDDAVLHATRDDEVALRDARVEDENEDRAHRRERREASRRARRRRRSRGRDEHFRCVDDLGFAFVVGGGGGGRVARSMAGCAAARTRWMGKNNIYATTARESAGCVWVDG